MEEGRFNNISYNYKKLIWQFKTKENKLKNIILRRSLIGNHVYLNITFLN